MLKKMCKKIKKHAKNRVYVKKKFIFAIKNLKKWQNLDLVL
jgi:hypothetical protein